MVLSATDLKAANSTSGILKVHSGYSSMKIATAADTAVINSFSPTNGAPGTLVTLNGSGFLNLSSFTIGNVSAIVIANSGTMLTGMVMPGATSGSISMSSSSGSATATGNFTVTPTGFPSSQQGSALIVTGESGTGYLGYSVAVSADGNTAIAGLPGDNSFMGAAVIFIRMNGVWSQQGPKLFGSGSTGFHVFQGIKVAISADGNTVVETGNKDNYGLGAFWVFTRSGSVWSQQGQKLSATDATASAGQGSSVSMSADGNTVLLGGDGDNVNQGAAWIFKRFGTTWSQEGSKLTGYGASSNSKLGNSVALSADGTTAIAGGPGDNGGLGSSWIFINNGFSWSRQGPKLAGSGSTGPSQQGNSAALSADGNTALIGGYADNNSQGASWIFTRSNGAWTQQGTKLVGTGNTGQSEQGTAVSLSADGTTALSSGPVDNSNVGASWVFTKNENGWIQQGNKLIGSGAAVGSQTDQGYGLSLSADGTTFLTGAPFGNNNAGSVWAFIKPLPVISVAGRLTDMSGQYGKDSITQSFTVSGSSMNAGILSTAPIGFELSLDQYVFTRSLMIGSAGTIKPTLVYIRLAARTPSGRYSGNIVLSSAGATAVNEVLVASIQSPAPLRISADSLTSNYGSPLPVLKIRYKGFVNQDSMDSLLTKPSIGTSASQQSFVGSYPVTVSAAADSNYVISYMQGDLTIIQAPLLITASDTSKNFGSALQNAASSTAFSVTGLKNLETILSVSITYGMGKAATDTVGNYIGSVIPSSAQGGTATLSNYSLLYNPGKIQVIMMAPVVTLFSAADLSSGNATLNASVTGGGGLTAVTIQYSTDPLMKNATQAVFSSGVSPMQPGSDTVFFSSKLSGLSEGTTYYYQVKATNSAASIYSQILNFGTSSNNASLSSAYLSTGAFSPSFDSSIYSYSSVVGTSESYVMLNLVTADSNATVQVNGQPYGNVSSEYLPLKSGDNFITIQVTAQDGTTRLAYTIGIHRIISLQTLSVSNVLSPNNDGQNDFWIIRDIEYYPQNTVTVYDRLGRVVYQKKGYMNDWGATLNGRYLNEDTYFYLIDLGPGEQKMKGFITVVREQ